MARRRDAGEGTLYYNKTHGYWEGQLPPELRNTPGIKNFVRHVDRKTAKDLLNDRITEAKRIRASRVKTPETYTVSECVRDWLESAGKTKLGPKTLKKHDGYLRNWIGPRIGDIALVDVTPRILIQFFDDIAPHLGTWALHDIRSALRRSIDLARIHLLINHNDAELLKELPEPGVKPRPKGAMDRDAVSRVMKAAEGTRHHALMAVSIYLGLRPGELIKLRWDYVDLDGRVIRVWRSTSKGDTTKTTTEANPLGSSRTLRIPDKALGPLTEWKTAQEAERAHAGPVWHDNNLVFCHEDGAPYTLDSLRYRYKKITEKAGVGPLPTYKGRHTFASVLWDSGLSTERIAPLMGHANSSVTETVYRHLIRPVLNDAADAIDDAFGD